MSPTRRISTFVGGRRTKWLVVVFWVIVFAVASPLASKFNDIQENEAVNWLPGSAESTKVVKESEAFQPGDTIPTVIVYERPSGITDADTAKVTDDISRYRGVDRVVGISDGELELTGEPGTSPAAASGPGEWTDTEPDVRDG